MRAWPKPKRMSPDGLGFFCLVRCPLLVLSKSKRAVWGRPSSDDGLPAQEERSRLVVNPSKKARTAQEQVSDEDPRHEDGGFSCKGL